MDVKVAIIHEDGPYGVGVAQGNEETCKQLGLQIVHKEGYAATSGADWMRQSLCDEALRRFLG